LVIFGADHKIYFHDVLGLQMNQMKKNVFVLLLASFAAVLFLAFFASFQYNYFKFADQAIFSTFQKDSEAFVIGGIVADNLNIEKYGWNLGGVGLNGVYKYPDSLMDGYAVFSGEAAPRSIIFEPYRSQYGVQSVFFSWLNSYQVFKDLSSLQGVNVSLLAIVIIALGFCYARIYGFLFASIFLLTMIGSPWIISFSRNLYWVSFLWFLPALFATLIYLNKNIYWRVFFALCVVLSIFIKSLAGYEYLSSITLFACSVFCVAPFFNGPKHALRKNLTLCILVFLACVLGFVCALLVHAGMRGDTIYSGLVNIVEQDVKRRTYAESTSFGPALEGALSSSPFSVVFTYIEVWATPLIFGIPGSFFKYLIVFVIFGFLCRAAISKKLDKKYLVMIVFFFSVPVSWFVLAKGHSFVHTHMNYVLWYFGFVQALLYVAMVFVFDFVRGMSFKRLALSVCLIGAGFSIYYISKSIENNRNLDLELKSVMLNSGGGHSSEAGFEVYVTLAGEIIYYKKDCSPASVSKRFFLHLFHDVKNENEGRDVVKGFDNLDFIWEDYKLAGPGFFSKYRGGCIAKIKLPSVYIDRISTGQFEFSDPRFARFWQLDVDLNAFRQRRLSAENVSDSNWVKGVSRSSASFFVENTFANRQSLKLGANLVFGFSKERKIVKVDYSESYINILVSGGMLNQNLDGFPHEILVGQ
jgi:hypothetical protein